MEDIIIVGAGLSGLTLAYLLKKENIKVKVLEASPRAGGRIQTIAGEKNLPLELGATWFSDIHPHLRSLIEELALEAFPQFTDGKALFQTKSFVPPLSFDVDHADLPSYRFKVGTIKLIDALYHSLDPSQIRLNTKIESISDQGSYVSLTDTNNITYESRKIVFCLPPQLLINNVSFQPALNQVLSDVMEKTSTWMAGTVKFIIGYAEPFWRQNGFSGLVYSHTGPAMEIYDHSDPDGTKGALMGFLNFSVSNLTPEQRKAMVIDQLVQLLGAGAGNPNFYMDKIWNDQFVAVENPPFLLPHQNNGNHLLQEAYYNNKLYFCGSETSSVYPGYMEGAIAAAILTSQKL